MSNSADALPRSLATINMVGSGPYETDSSMTEDGLEIYFASDRGKASAEFDIYVATRMTTNEAFGAPALVTELTTPNAETGSISPDGLTYYMTRAGVAGVLVSTRGARGMTWSTPVQVPQLSIITDAVNPSISGDGLSFVVNGVVSGNVELFVYTRSSTSEPWEVPRQVTEIASPEPDGAGSFDASGLTMVFHTEREAAGMRKIYETSRPSRDAQFVFARTYPLNELGTGGDPWISPDYRTITFTRDGDLYMSTR
jgi:Tol biopolymer transport system component